MISANTPLLSYSGNGVTTTFAAPQAIDSDDIQASLFSSSGTETQLVNGGTFTVTGTGPSSWNVVPTTIPATGETLVVYRSTSPLRISDYSDTRIPPSTMNNNEDNAVLMIQELHNKLNRSFYVSVGESWSGQLPKASTRAGGILGFDSSGAPTVLFTTSGASTSYVDDQIAQFNLKKGAACATTANITLSGEQTIDGILTSSSRVLVKNQSTGSQNGLYVSSSGAWTRSTDADTGTELTGCIVPVIAGTTNGGLCYKNSNTSITLGVTSITFSPFATGTVTSVGVTVPSILSATGSPVTSSGTIAISLANQTANKVFAGPTSGGAASPTFRSLVAADLPIVHEYVSNSSSTDADDTTSFVTGTTGEGNGADGGGSVGVIRTTNITVAGGRKKRVSLSTAITGSTLYSIEFWTGVAWMKSEFSMVLNSTSGVAGLQTCEPASNETIGIGIDPVSSTLIDITFGKYAQLDYNANTLPWSSALFRSGTQWRLHVIHFS